jgi:hypothetical protein
MKKLMQGLLISIILLSNVIGIQANPFTTRLTSTATNIEAGQSFTITFEVRGSAGIYGLTTNLNYDSNKLEITGSSAQNGFALTLGTKIVVDHTELKSGNFNFVRITFKAKSGFAVGENTQISISNVVGSDGSKDVSGSGSSVTINIVPPRSTNNYLAGLETNAGTINFNKSTLSYTLIVDNNVTSASITGSVEDPKSSVSGLGNKTLKVYSNPFNITVTAENGATRRYTLNIIRRDESGNAGALSTNNALNTLIVDVCSLSFDSEKLEYTCEVDNLVEAYKVSATLKDTKSTLDIDAPEKLSLGDNVITIKVTAESGDVRTYVLTINRSTSAPTVAIEKLEDALKTLVSDEVGIIKPEDGVISEEVLELIKDASKTLVVKGKDDSGTTLYEWYIDGTKVNTAQPIKTNLEFVSVNQNLFDTQTNYAKGITLKFEKNPNLPAGTTVKVFLDSSLLGYETINLYYFNPDTQKLELKHENLQVIENYVIIPLEHTSEYVLTPAILKQNTSTSTQFMSQTLWIGLVGAQFVVILILVVLLGKKKKYS